MDKIIVAIDGGNGVGKSTFINNILSISMQHAFANVMDNDKLKCFDWWFYKSTPVELINEVVNELISRDKYIRTIKEQIVFLDKGVTTLEARLYATFVMRGISSDRITEYIEMYRNKTMILSKENVRILITKEPIIFQGNAFFTKYNEIQNEYLGQKNFEHVFDNQQNHHCTESMVDETIKSIKKYWISQEQLNTKTIKKVYGISGLSECGKSTCGHYMSSHHSIWNLKLAYFDVLVQEYYGIMRSDAYYNHSMLHAFIFFCNKHYYKTRVSLESFYGFEFIEILRQALGERFILLYIDTNENLRFARSKDTIDVLQAKDRRKIEQHVPELRTKCDVIVSNNNDMEALYRQIDRVVLNLFDYSKIKLTDIESYALEYEYKTTIDSICHDINTKYKDNLCLFAVVGSCSFGAAIPGWSDIDILVIVQELSEGLLGYLGSLPNKHTIHIGVNCFSIEEVMSLSIDTKNKWYFYYIQNRLVAPIYVDRAFLTPTISLEQLKNEQKMHINEIRFSIQRSLHNTNEANSKKLFKNLIILMKIHLLISYEIVAKTTQEVYLLYKSLKGINCGETVDLAALPHLEIEKVKKLAKVVLENV